MNETNIPPEQLLGTFEYGDRLNAALLIVLIVIGIIWLAAKVLKVLIDRLDRKAQALIEAERAELPVTLTAADIEADIKRLTFTNQVLKMIELLVQRSTAFHFYKQLGKLPLDKFTATMQEAMISEVANSTFNSLNLVELAERSILTVDYLNDYIINTAIVTVDATLSDLINGETSTPVTKTTINSTMGDMKL